MATRNPSLSCAAAKTGGFAGETMLAQRIMIRKAEAIVLSLAVLLPLAFLGLRGYAWIRFRQIRHRAYTEFKDDFAGHSTVTGPPIKPGSSCEQKMEILWEDLTIALPKTGSVMTTGIWHRLKYPCFSFTLAVDLPGHGHLAGLPEAWGETGFHKHKTVVETPIERIRFADTVAELTDLTLVMTAKGALMSQVGRDRHVEFQTETLRGYISGSATVSTHVAINGFLADNLNRAFSMLFFNLKDDCEDSEIEAFLGNVSIRETR